MTIPLTVREDILYFHVVEGVVITSSTVHNELTGRTASDSHPISAITDLQSALDAKVSDADVTAAIAAAVLDDLADVTSTAPSDGEVLTWDAGTSQWVPAAGGGGGGGDVPSSRTLTAGTGLSGGGDLTADRTFNVDFGTTAGTVAEGNDARLSDARTPTGAAGGDLSGSYPAPVIGAGKVTSAHIADGTIVDGDVSPSAGIALSKLAVDPLARANHTGTQAQSTVTNLVSDLAGKAAAVHAHAGADITSGTIATARLGSGTADSSVFLRGDQTWATPAGGGSTWSPPSGAWVPLAASYNGSSGGGGGSGGTTSQTNGLAILQWCQLPAAVSINGLRVFLNTANGGASARAGLSLWLPDGPNGRPGTGISAPSANVAINGSPGEKEVTWATAVTLPVSGFWFAWTPYGLDTSGTNPNFWAYPRGNDHLWASGIAPSGNSRRPQMIVTGLADYTPPTNPTVSSQHVLGSTVDATAVMVRIA